VVEEKAAGRARWKLWLGAGLALFLAYRSLFIGDAHEIGPFRDTIAGAFNTFGLLPQAPGFDGEHGFGGRTTLIHRQMVLDPNYADRMIALVGVELPQGPENADWWNVFIIRLTPIDSDLKAAVSYYAESKLCTLDPVRAQAFTSQCNVAPSPVSASPAAGSSPALGVSPASQASLQTAAPRARNLYQGCEAGSNYYRRIGNSDVVCGCGYDYKAESLDGSSVCAGGRYNYKAENRDGTMVACGGLYDYKGESRDGNHVCAGGLYDYHAESRNGNSVACGGRYDYKAESRDGNAVCAGGRYNYFAESRNGNAVACGGLYQYKATSRDGTMTCYGGLYR